MRKFLLPLAIVLSLSAFAEVKVLKNFTLIDGTGKAAIADVGMVIENGRITRIGSAANIKPPAGAQVIDLTGKFVMPGIINVHGHVGNTVDMSQNAKFFTRENIEKNLRTYASYGVTTVLSLGTDQDLIFQIRDEQRAGRPTFARVYTAGQGFTVKGGVGGTPPGTYNIEDAGEIPRDVKALAAKKVDMVKMWVDDALGKRRKMPFEMSSAIIDNAHRNRLRVAAHIFYLADAKQLANAGVDALAHSVRDAPVDQELIDNMKKHHTWQAATLTREASMFAYAQPFPLLEDIFFSRSLSPAVIANLNDPANQKKISSDPDFAKFPVFLETAQKNLKRLADAGVPYALGTDSGPPGRFPGFFEQWEMELMVDAGLTPTQVIVAATKSGAEFLHANNLGTLETGKWADLIVLNANPAANIKNTRTIDSVYMAGNRVEMR
jgi:imidazolonepropionase-like amidohydrolase